MARSGWRLPVSTASTIPRDSMTDDSAPKALLTPLDPESLMALQRHQEIRAKIAHDMLELEQEKVRLLVLAQGFDKEAHSLFAKLLTERGQNADAKVYVDFKDGLLKPVGEPNVHSLAKPPYPPL